MKRAAAALLPVLWLAAVMAVAAPGRVAAADGEGCFELVTGQVTVGAADARFVEDRGLVTVLELTGDYARHLPGGEPNSDPRAAIAREYLAHHPDEVDFLIVFSSFDFASGDAVAFNWVVQNSDQGVGLPLFDNSPAFGSDGHLQGFIDMKALSGWESRPEVPGFEHTLTTLGHEVLHRWAAYARFRGPGGETSDALLGRDGSHWSFLLATGASVLYGHDWRDNGDGTFTALGAEKVFSPLDLYLAGFYAAEEVPPFTLLTSPGADPDALPVVGTTLAATARTVTVDDIIAVEGPRQPAAGMAPREFRAAFLLVTRPGDTVTSAQVAAVDRIRRQLGTRFSVLTAGRGLLQVSPPVVPGGEAGAPEPVAGGAPRPGGADPTAGLTWLRQAQTAEGYWQDTVATRGRETAVASTALTALDPLFVRGGDAAGWLAGAAGESTDTVARRALALARLDTPAGALLTQLGGWQNADGGWGAAPGYASDPLDTALAVLALAGHDDPVAAAGAGWLRSVQNPDGGWSGATGGASRTAVTVTALAALDAVGQGEAAAAAALAFLAGRQNADGGFGDSPSTSHDTAAVLAALIGRGSLAGVDGTAAAAWLDGRQGEDGSWDGSVYATSLAVGALRRFAFPNWAFAAPAALVPELPRDGERLMLTFTLVNDGNAIAPAATLRLYDADPAAGGVPVDEAALPALAPGGSLLATLLWDTLDRPGSTTLVAVVDADGVVEELSEGDNRQTIPVEVAPAPEIPDLEVRADDIAFIPELPGELPAELAVAVTVRNLGRADAAGVVVRLLLGPADGGEVIGEQTVLVPERSSLAVAFSYTLAAADETLFTVVADAAETVAEASEDNNIASRNLPLQAGVDLAVTTADLLLEGLPHTGADIVFQAVLRNRGTVDSPEATARFLVTDGTETRLLAEPQVQIAAGSTISREVPWRVDLSGELSFVVELDPQGLVPETDEGNNAASLAFTAGAPGLPDLVLDHAGLVFTPDPGRQGQPLTLAGEVRNAGAAAGAFSVVFYDGDPAAGASAFGPPQPVAALAPGEIAAVTLALPPLAAAADHLVFAVADPAGEVEELAEGNNIAFRELVVLSLPDAAVAAAGLRLEPRFPAPGQPVTLTVTVANFGEQGLAGLVVRAFDGEPGAGGSSVGPDAVLAEVPGGGSATAVFNWVYGAAGGPRPLVVRLDPDGAVAEGSESNNEARIDVAVQEGDFVVSERYFSPDGDGVQDATRLFFRLDAPATVAVEVVDREGGEVVRRETGPALTGVDAGDFEWDGRDGSGRLARDGDYTLRVVDAAGAVLGEAVVTLDTDRTSLFASAGTPYESLVNLTCDLPSVRGLQVTDDEQRVYFYIAEQGDPSYPMGIYRMAPDGTDVELLVPASWFPPLYRPNGLVVSGDGSYFAFWSTRSALPRRSEAWLASGDGSGRTLLDGVNELVGFTAEGDALMVETAAGIERRPVAGSTPPETFFAGSVFGAALSPDRRRMVLEDSADRLVLVDLDNGSTTVLLTNLGSFANVENSAWSPDSRQLAVLGSISGSGDQRVWVFDADGTARGEMHLPRRDDLAFFDAHPRRGQLEGPFYLLSVDPPTWSADGDELVLYIEWVDEGPSCSAFGALLRFDIVSGEPVAVAWTEPYPWCGSYHVSTWDGSAWVERGALHYALGFADRRLELSPWLPDAEGELKVRVRQAGFEAAHVESLALVAGGDREPPVEAFLVPGGTPVLADVRYADGDVLDLHGREMEVHWDGVPEGSRLELSLVAREERLSDRDAIPFRYPEADGAAYTVLLTPGAPLVVDGEQTAADALGTPLFEVISHPDTGHPAGPVAGWVASDGEVLYAALDFTVDNTRDGDADWAELAVRTPGGWRSFRVTESDATWGAVGFTRTGRVHHRHKVYELRLPLAEIGAQPGDAVDLYFRAYGTAAQLPGEAENLLPAAFFYEPFWDPNDRGLLVKGGIYWALRPAPGAILRPALAPLSSGQGRGFLPSGRSFLADSGVARNDPDSACYLRGATDTWAYRSLANLTADLRARRPAGSAGVVLEGTAADRHLERWSLEYATAAQPDLWHPVAPPESTPVIDDRFTTWVPPAAGAYYVRLSAEDLAGNVRRRVRRVAAAGTPSITDLYLSPRLFSPNGDGVLDTALLHYRVLAPVHLEIQIFDAAGRRVRTLVRDHSQIGLEVDVLWDGRDDAGLPLPDGVYRLTVQGYELFVTLDDTPPAVSLELLGPFGCVDGAVAVAASLVVRVIDEHFDVDGGALLETGLGESPLTWASLPIGLSPVGDTGTVFAGSRPLALGELVGHGFRLTAIDRAGNRRVIQVPPAAESLALTGFGAPQLDPATGRVVSPPAPCDGDLGELPVAPVRLAAAEAVAAPLAQVFLQHQALPVIVVGGAEVPGPVDPDGWVEVPVSVFYPPGGSVPVVGGGPPEGGFDLTWDMAGVVPGGYTAVRLRTVDLGGGERFSQTLQLTPGGVFFLGPNAPADDEGRELELVQALRAQLDPGTDTGLALWGTESVSEPLAEVALVLSSEEDPRYAVPRSIPAAAIAEGGFLFLAEDWQACLTYSGYLTAETAPEADPAGGGTVVRRLRSNDLEFRFPCLALDVEVSPPQVGDCGGPAAATTRTLTLRPQSLDGGALQLLTLALDDGAGGEELLASFSGPQSGAAFAVEVDPGEGAEGERRYVARLTNVAGEEASEAVDLVSDHTPPALAITYPGEGDRVCGVPPLGSVFIEGSITDAGGYAAALTVREVGELGPGAGLEPPTDGTGMAPFELLQVAADGTVEAPAGPRLAGRSFGGRLGEIAGRSGELTAHLEVADNGGFRRCAERSFVFDGAVEGAAAAFDRRVFSPNDDGFVDVATLGVAAAEAVEITVDVYASTYGEQYTEETCASPETRVRTFAAGLPLPGSLPLVWDGRDDNGAPVPDGWYIATIRLRDGCGNEILLFDPAVSSPLCLSVDTTPPAVAIAAPAPGDPLGLLVEVVGTVTDRHLQAYSVDYGVGSDPPAWVTLDGDERPHPQPAVLATWNTLGLAGEHTLRLFAGDEVGNRAEVRVPLVLTAPAGVVSELSAQPRPFSPDGDGRRETAAVRFGLLLPAVVDLDVLDAGGQTVRRLVHGATLPAGVTVREWDGRTDGGAPAADGQYTVQLFARAADAPSLVQSERVTAVLDRTPPLLAVSRPGAYVTPTGAVVGTVDDANLRDYAVYLTDSPAAPAWSEVGTGTSSRVEAPLASLAGLAEGDWALRLTATDAGEIGSELVLPFTVDATPPQVALVAPAAGSVVGPAAGAPPVRGSVEEDHLAAWRLELGAGATPTAWSELAAGTTLPPPDPLLAWDLTVLADGVYTLRLVAEDLASQVAVAAASLTVDATPPTLALTAPVDGGYVTGPGVVTGTVIDLHLVEYRLAVAPGPPGSSPQFSPLADGTVAVTGGRLGDWLTLPPDGVHTLRLSAADAAGNEAVVFAAVTVDTDPPAAPGGLTAAVEGGDAVLAWDANGESDLAGYVVDRGGVRLTGAPLPSPAFRDAGLAEGVYTYTVRAVDRAGLESSPSAPATARLDTTPPAAALFRPLAGARVSGLVEVVGTAHAADDFKEYRLYAEASGGARVLLRRSPVPVQAATLGEWSTLGLAEGSVYTLRLEAEDLTRNVAVSERPVTVDNQPPAAPSGLAATVSAADVDLTWAANAEADLAGYLLYRDGRLVNASGPVVGDLAPYALTATAFHDTALPDGTFTYELYALDTAGNVSDPAPSAEATVETRAPSAALVVPADGERFAGGLYLLAESADRDVDRVLFQRREVGEAVWTDLGAADDEEPWEAQWDTAGLPYGDYQLRAVATDRGGRTDAAPPAITVTYTDLTAPAPVTGVATAVDGGAVTVTWQAGTEDDLAGYHVERTRDGGSAARLTAAPVAGTLFTDADVVDGDYTYTVIAVDATGNEAESSPPAAAKVYTPRLVQPLTPTAATVTALEGSGEAGAAVAGSVAGPGGSQPLPAATAGPDGAFAFAGIGLERGETTLTVRLTDAAGNVSKPAAVGVVSAPPPPAPSGLAALADGLDVALTWDPVAEPGLLGYRITRDGAASPPPAPLAEPATASASSSVSIFRPPSAAADGDPSTYWYPAGGGPYTGEWLRLDWVQPQQVARVEIDWAGQNAIDFDLEGWDGTVWVPVARVRGATGTATAVDLAAPYRSDRLRLVFRHLEAWPQVAEVRVLVHPLIAATSAVDTAPDGYHDYRVIAVGALGLESAPSAPVETPVGDVEPPLPVTLAATAAGSDVTLTWTASVSPDVARYGVYRDGVAIATHDDLGSLVYTDVGLLNGLYRYTVVALDAAGNVSAPSNEVEVSVAVAPPATPQGLSVVPVAAGGALDLAWAPGPGPAPALYRVERGTVAGGPYTPVGETAATAYRDGGLADGVEQFYVVRGLDAAGNAGPPSAEASGVPTDSVAPAAPVLHRPGFAGWVFETTAPAVELGGTAEPGARVELFRGAIRLGETMATATTEITASGLDFYGDVHLSPDGSRAWLDGGYQHEIFDFAGSSLTPVEGLPEGDVRWLADGSGVVIGDDYRVIRYRLGGVAETLAAVDQVWAVVPGPGELLAVAARRDGVHGIWSFVPGFPGAPDGGTWRLLVEAYVDEVGAESLAWSPDGAWLAYRLDHTEGLAIVPAAGGDPLPVSTSSGPSPPRWSPAADALVYTVEDAGYDEQVWVYRLATGASDPLTSGPGEHRFPVVTADGTAVAAEAEDAGVYLFPLDPEAGGEPELLLPFAGSAGLDGSDAGGGNLLFVVDDEPVLAAPAGRFTWPSALLVPGDNPFTAVAHDAAGNSGPVSQPMVLRRLAGARPDLVIAVGDLAVVPAVPRLGESARFTATLRNGGDAAAPAAGLAAVVTGPAAYRLPLDATAGLPPLAPGEATTLSWDATIGGDPGAYTLLVSADPEGLVAEASEANNVAELGFVAVEEGRQALVVATDRASYPPAAALAITVDLLNYGDPFAGTLTVTVEDAAGYPVEELLETPVETVPYAGSRRWELTWPSAGVLAGDYLVAARLADDAGAAAAAGEAAFRLADSVQLAARVETDRASYPVGASVRILGGVDYLAGNAVVSGAELRLTLADAVGGPVAAWVLPLGDLLPGATGQTAVDWESVGSPAGPYRATAEVLRDGEPVAGAETLFELAAAPAAVIGGITLSDATPAVGVPVTATISLANPGSEALTAVPLRLRLRRDGAELEVRELVAELPAGGTDQWQETFATGALGLGSYLLVLEAELPGDGGPETRTLAVAAFTTRDGTVPALSVVAPEAAAVVTATAALTVRAVDALSPVERVEARLDAGAWALLPSTDPAASLYGAALAVLGDLVEGEHQLSVRAADSWNNLAVAAPLAFSVDTTPPEIVVSGVEDGAVYPGEVVPVVTVTDEHPSTQTLTLDAVAYVSGTPVAAAGDHLLAVTAVDAAGNSTAVELAFTIEPPELAVAAATAPEAAAELVFVLTLSAPADGLVRVAYATADGTATAGEDYQAVAGSLEIAAGETAGAVAVALVDDTVVEGDETLRLVLSAPEGATLAASEAVGTIVDDDEAPPAGCGEHPLGLAGTFNVFVLGSVSQNASDTEGRLAAGSDATLASYSVGQREPTAGGVDSLVVGGHLIFNQGTVHGGDVAYGLTATLANVTIPDGTARQATPVDFAAEGAYLRDLADGLAALPATGSTDIPPWKVITLHGDEPELNVFTLPGAELAVASGLTIEAPAGSTSLVNVDGEAAVMQNFGFTLVGVTRQDVVFNLHQATSLTMQGIGVEGSLLAPRAAVQFNNGVILGTLVAASLQGNGQSNRELFTGCLPGGGAPGAGPATLTAADAVATEGDEGSAEVEVVLSLSAPVFGPVAVAWATADGSATAGEDYEAAAGTLELAPGVTEGRLVVTLLGDRVLEGDESFEIELSAATGATLATPSVAVTIVDDERCAGPNLLANPGAEQGAEGSGVPGWTAVEGGGWQPRSADPLPFEGEAYFFAGEAEVAELVQEVDLAPYAAAIAAGGQRFAFQGFVRTYDEVPEDSARVVVEYLAADGETVLDAFDSGELSSLDAWLAVADERAVPVATARARVRLRTVRYAAEGDADGYFDALSLVSVGTPVLLLDDAEVLEGAAGSAAEGAVPVRLSCALPEPLELAWSTADGSATAGEDYSAAAGALYELPAREAEGGLPLEVLGDAVAEGPETLTVSLDAAPDGVVALDGAATVTIVEEPPAPACAEPALGVAQGFNAFVLGALTYSNTSVDGRLAAGGSATLSGLGIGQALAPATGPRDTLVVAGHLIFANGTVYGGDVAYGLSATLSGVAIPAGVARQATPVDFAAAQPALAALSDALAALPAGGVAEVPPWNSITLHGGDPELNVFSLPAATLAVATGITFDVPAGSTALINVSGGPATMHYFGFNLGAGASRRRVLFNFPDATALTVEGIGVEGSLLAPRAAVQFNNGSVFGTLVGASLSGSGHLGHEPFEGCLPAAP